MAPEEAAGLQRCAVPISCFDYQEKAGKYLSDIFRVLHKTVLPYSSAPLAALCRELPVYNVDGAKGGHQVDSVCDHGGQQG